jgi:uncharacterized protein YneF (UPF0154 family)
MRGAMYLDLLTISVSLVALILGAAIGWLIARSRFTRMIAEVNGKLVLERRLNKQLGEPVQVNAVRSLMNATDLTPSAEREPTVASG